MADRGRVRSRRGWILVAVAIAVAAVGGAFWLSADRQPAETARQAQLQAMRALLQSEFPDDYEYFVKTYEKAEYSPYGSVDNSLEYHSGHVFDRYARHLRMAPDDALFDYIKARRDWLKAAGPRPLFNCDHLGTRGDAGMAFEGDWFVRSLKAARLGMAHPTGRPLPTQADYDALLLQAANPEDRFLLQELVKTRGEARVTEEQNCKNLLIWFTALSGLEPDAAARLLVANGISGLP